MFGSRRFDQLRRLPIGAAFFRSYCKNVNIEDEEEHEDECKVR
jgi:hypothetical protein